MKKLAFMFGQTIQERNLVFTLLYIKNKKKKRLYNSKLIQIQVQQGGDFDIDFVVKGPNGDVILNGERERQGDYVFTGNSYGEYTFCFSNEMSTFVEKLVDFEITIENEIRPDFKLDSSGKEQPAKVTEMEETLYRLGNGITNIARTQKYFRSRENRNSATVASTKGRIAWFAFLESMAIVAMAACQVFIVKNFFNTKRGSV